MEFTELADYAIPAGALVEWLPCATGPWVPDPRPVSYIHEAHLNRSAAGAGDKSWLGTAFEISGPLDVDAFRVALGRWIDRHEVLRSHTVLEPSSGEITRHTVPIGGIDIGVVSHGYDASSQDNFDHLHRLFDDYASPHSWPSYVFATLTPRGGDGPFTVFFAADHSIIDGFSIVLVAHEIAALYREASTGSAANLFPVGSYVDFGAVEREQMADMEAEKAAVEIWRKALGTDGLPQFPLPIGERGTDSQNGLSTWLLDAEQSKAFSSTCSRRRGVFRRTTRRTCGRRSRSRGIRSIRGRDAGSHPQRSGVGGCARLVRRTVPGRVRRWIGLFVRRPRDTRRRIDRFGQACRRGPVRSDR